MSAIENLSAAQRNKQPIFDVLVEYLPGSQQILEVGSGDGTHARYALERLPQACWQTSEAPAHVRRLTAALADIGGEQLPSPRALDVRGRWPDEKYDAIFAANVAHIMNMEAVEAFFAGAGTHLRIRGLLCLYGPFFSQDRAPEQGNLAFDRALRMRDPGMGIRRIEMLDKMASGNGLLRVARHDMPSNNRLLIWQYGAE